MKIVILNITKYKENDAIIDGINMEGPVSFLAKGILKNKSPNTFLNNPLSIIEASFIEGNYKHPILKEAQLLFTPRKINESFEYLASLSVIQEATRFILQDEDKNQVFLLLQNVVKALKEMEQPYLILLIYLAQLLKISGYELETNKCIYCGSKKNIVAFSFVEGGFICQGCLEEGIATDLNKNQMLLIRYICNKTDFDNLPLSQFSKEDQLIALNHFFIFINDCFGFRLKSASLINN